jgi:Ca2+-binding RTX toxin-like protein
MTAAHVISYTPKSAQQESFLSVSGLTDPSWEVGQSAQILGANFTVGQLGSATITLRDGAAEVATIAVIADTSDQLSLDAITADYIVADGSGAAAMLGPNLLVSSTSLGTDAGGSGLEVYKMVLSDNSEFLVYEEQNGFFKLEYIPADGGNGRVAYVAEFPAIDVGTTERSEVVRFNQLFVDQAQIGGVTVEIDVYGTPFSGDVLDVAVTAVPTASATDATDSTRVNFTDGSDNIVAYYTTTLDQTDRAEGFTGKVVANNADGSTTTYYVQGIESLKFDTLDGSGAPFPYNLSGGGTTEPPVVDPNAPDYTTADDTAHAGYVGDSADNYAVISDGVSGNYSIDGAGGFDVVELQDKVFLYGERVIESTTAANTYLVQSRIGGDFVTIGSVVRNADETVVLTKEAITSINQLAATVTLTAVEALALVEPPANEWSDPVTELVPLTILTEVDPTDGYASIQGSIFSDQIAIDASLSTPFIGEVMGIGGSDRVTVNLGSLVSTAASFAQVSTPVFGYDYYSEFTYFYEGNPTDQTDDLTMSVLIYPASPGSDYETSATVEVISSQATFDEWGYAEPDILSVDISGVDTLEIGGLTLDLKFMSDIAERGSAKYNDSDDLIATHAGDPRDNWSAQTSREAAESDLRIDESSATAGKVLIGFDDDFYINIADPSTRLTEELRGGSFDDVLIGRGGHNRLDGGDGYDTVDYSFAGEAVRVSLFEVGEQFTGVSNDTLARVENIVGTYNSDILGGNGRQNGVDGGMGDDFIDGGRGNDHLLGGEGNDHIMGGVGNDVIEGGFGNDTLSGGIGRDTFVFHHPDGVSFMSSGLEGSDVITDFNPYADKILITITSGMGDMYATDFAGLVVDVDAGTNTSPMADVIDNNLHFVMDSQTNIGSLMLRVGGGSTDEIEVTSFQAGLDLTAFEVSSYVNVDILSFNAVGFH